MPEIPRAHPQQSVSCIVRSPPTPHPLTLVLSFGSDLADDRRASSAVDECADPAPPRAAGQFDAVPSELAMNYRRLNARQLEILRWIASKSTEIAWDAATFGTTVIALADRQLVTISRTSKDLNPKVTAAGVHYMEHETFPEGHSKPTYGRWQNSELRVDATVLPPPHPVHPLATFYSVTEAAERLGAKESWYLDKLHARRLPGHKRGGRWQVTEHDIKDALQLTYVATHLPPDDSGKHPRRMKYNVTTTQAELTEEQSIPDPRPIVTYSVAEAAKKIGASKEWYTRHLRERKLPGHKIGRKWRLTDSDIFAALDLTYKPALVLAPDPAGLSPRSRQYVQRNSTRRATKRLGC
ncbi:helix-turn-helix domain-containing protein [Antrihabitans sp. YC3-6]|uniref:Helix-turn-helix domain-containing protein n=1 Tax=Antrihabitans stalagmiti TaxID=2799499 RepID=A0A934NRI5_9NOCA|nr:helix-turn-helix domain-containing protein [Antrihabitans stalagmiti]MBJ8340013.1 helix-turn-helix domain-containing protein [Antrihabitans stalagmiti]